ncbi:hypothetical protein BpHYR1_049058 [Brachionus plicatilis]|uniref:Uncharacterized protein n=1 Tax=Brachionus plicatilis TaxID=10195 RepID=A0A3M7SE40_BRAPC|nr:hypothetical protein BpHYR1_049058 [Brachionus plicatilis]
MIFRDNLWSKKDYKKNILFDKKGSKRIKRTLLVFSFVSKALSADTFSPSHLILISLASSYFSSRSTANFFLSLLNSLSRAHILLSKSAILFKEASSLSTGARLWPRLTLASSFCFIKGRSVSLDVFWRRKTTDLGLSMRMAEERRLASDLVGESDRLDTSESELYESDINEQLV